eukprot:5162576-Prymnesium_polylepis.1
MRSKYTLSRLQNHPSQDYATQVNPLKIMQPKSTVSRLSLSDVADATFAMRCDLAPWSAGGLD